jgi:uncharacterized damage-inducible protein DinB
MIAFDELFTYDAWANRETFAAIRSSCGGGAATRSAADERLAAARALKAMAHIVAAEVLWYERSRHTEHPVVVWPELTLDECAAQIERISELWRTFVHGISETTLRTVIPYFNSKGEPWQNTVEHILMHVVMHSAYHRGQIAAHVRACGHTPAYTDYIQYVRAVRRPN